MPKIKYIALTSLVLFIGSLAFVLVSLGYTSIDNLSGQRFKTRIDDFEQKEKEMIEVEKSYKEWQGIDRSYREFKDQYLLKFADLSRFRASLESMIRRNYLERVNSHWQYPPVANVDVERVRITLELRGSYPDLKKFIFTIESLDTIIFFKELTLSKIGTGGRGNLVLEVYYVK